MSPDVLFIQTTSKSVVLTTALLFLCPTLTVNGTCHVYLDKFKSSQPIRVQNSGRLPARADIFTTATGDFQTEKGIFLLLEVFSLKS